MRLIDADALKEQAYTSWECKSQPCQVVDVQDIDNAPTVDAVPVVRCSDCKYYDEKDHNCLDEMGYARRWMPTDFCSFGERREE